MGAGGGVNSMLTRVLVNTKQRNQSNYKGVFASFEAINVSYVGKNLCVVWCLCRITPTNSQLVPVV